MAPTIANAITKYFPAIFEDNIIKLIPYVRNIDTPYICVPNIKSVSARDSDRAFHPVILPRLNIGIANKLILLNIGIVKPSPIANITNTNIVIILLFNSNTR